MNDDSELAVTVKLSKRNRIQSIDFSIGTRSKCNGKQHQTMVGAKSINHKFCVNFCCCCSFLSLVASHPFEKCSLFVSGLDGRSLTVSLRSVLSAQISTNPYGKFGVSCDWKCLPLEATPKIYVRSSSRRKLLRQKLLPCVCVRALFCAFRV